MIGRAIISKEGIFNGNRTFPVFLVEKLIFFFQMEHFFSHWEHFKGTMK